jgi:DNA invertase Pin-like site-specific DNA recombinase
MTSDKITPEHLTRKAIVYIRQSTIGQVRHNLESQRRQYELADKARAMGWREVDVVDEDLGRSGATAVNRSGFARMVASVGLRDIGAVFSLEASRLARNNRDWYHLLDLCALVNTLIVDFDGVYDPRLMNDRLLLGLKGTMSEFELGLIRRRAHEALRQMVQRGELYPTLPIGYVRTHDDRCEKDPDLRIQHAIQVVFQKFAEVGSVRQVLLWFREEGIPLPTVAYGAMVGRSSGSSPATTPSTNSSLIRSMRAPMCLDGPGRGPRSWESRRSKSAADVASARTGMRSSKITTRRISLGTSTSETRSKSGRTRA